MLPADTWADIREGYKGPIWVREHYEWSMPARVELTVIDSGFAKAGSYVVVDIKPAEGGDRRFKITWDRRGKGLFGKVFVGLMALTRGAAIRRSFKMGLARIESARAQRMLN